MSVNQNTQMIISKISHELRNPLTMIYSTLQLIETQHPETKDFRHWPDLIQDVEFMKLLLEDLSSFNNTNHLNFSTFSFRSFLEHISLSFAASIANTELEFISKIDSSINQITGDKTKLQEVFLNLLKNASDAAQPDQSIQLHACQNQDHIIITIQDTGCGIPEDRLPTIFHPFTTYKKNGTGLGLSISDSIIRAHHGTIQVSSIVNQGTMFKVMLPANQESDNHTGE